METEVRTDSPRGGLTRTPGTGTPGAPLILVMALVVIGMVVVFGSSKSTVFQAASMQQYYGPVTGHEFASFLRARHAAGNGEDASFRRAMDLAAAAGDRPVVDAMREQFTEPIAAETAE